MSVRPRARSWPCLSSSSSSLGSRLNAQCVSVQDVNVTELVGMMFDTKITRELSIVLNEDGIMTSVEPLALAGGGAEATWEWWEERRMAEAVLKSAVASEEVDISTHFDAYKRYLAMEKADILLAHEEYFTAISDGDFEAMSSLWARDDSAVCIMPRDNVVLSGSQHIMAAFLGTFLGAASAPRNVWRPSDIRLQFQGDLAVVTCEANEISRVSGGLLSKHSTTSVFVRSHASDRHLLLVSVTTPLSSPSSMSSGAGKGPRSGSQRGGSKAIARDTYRDPTAAKARPRGGGGQGVMSIQQLLGNGLGGNMEIVRGISGGGDEDEEDDDDDDEDEGGADIVVRASDGKNDGNDDNDGDDDDEAADVRSMLQARIRSTLRQAMNKMANEPEGGPGGGGGGRAGVVIIGSDGITTRRADLGPQAEGGGNDMGEGGRRRDMLNDNNNNDKEDEEGGRSSKELASKTLMAVRWLCRRGRLTHDEKRRITSDLIVSVARGKFSQAEVAFSLIVGGGRPSEDDINLPVDMSLIDESDMEEFCDVCRLIAKSCAGDEDGGPREGRRNDR